MKRALHSHFSPREKVKAQISRWTILWSILVMCSMQINGQTISTGTVECNCISGASSPELGQFTDFISINSGPGETWEVVSATGVFDQSSPDLPAVQIPLATGTEFPNTFGNQYTLTVKRNSGDDFEIVASNGTESVTITNQHVCQYPDIQIVGDMGTCVETTETYEINVDQSQLQNINWNVTGGTIISGQGSSTLRVEWAAAETTGRIILSGEASGSDGAANSFCEFRDTAFVDVVSETAPVLACNNKVNISLNGSCELTVTPSLMLEDMMFTDASYDVILRDIAADTLIPNKTLNGNYTNMDIEVKVIHECSGQSCWGTIRLEDKSIPTLDCGDDVTVNCDEASSPDATGLPIPDGSNVTVIDENTFFVDGFDQCGGLTLDFYDQANTNLCTGPFSSEITRSWLATDVAGNTSTCESKIYIRRATFDDLTFPEIYDDVLGGQPSIQACSVYPETEDGFPSPDFTGRPEGTFCMNVQVEYVDILITGCSDESYKIKRRWEVTDLCGNEGDTVYNQIITVADNEPPVCSAPPEFETSTNPLACTATINVPAPNVIFECSEWDYFVSYKLADGSGNPFEFATTDGVSRNSDGTYTIRDIPAGQERVWVVYNLMDDCGNATECFTEVDIIDDEEPTPVCDLYTFVALNEDGVAWAGPEALNDGSWDNCMLESMDLRRMDSACGETSQFRDKVKFCCDDVGTTVMVALRVFDASGNSNQCMVEVEVQDNIPPVITFCPADTELDCLDDVAFLDRFGTIEATDNCGFTTSEEVDRSNADCGNGSIVRTFTATDVFGNESTCQQVITIVNQDPFYINSLNPNASNDDVIWPRDYTSTNGCLDTGVEPEDLPSANGFPRTFENSCSEVSVTHEDIVFQFVDEACFKILRTWTIIDFCQYNPFFPNDGGKWDYTQVIKVQNNVKPTIESGCDADDIEIEQLDNCRARYTLSASGSDDCTPEDKLKWSYEIDLNANGVVDFSGTGSSFTRTDNFLTLKVTWTVEDQCGNVESCDGTYTLDDTKPPTPYCLSEVVTVLMETDGTVEIWAKDFDRGSEDNCSDVVISFSADITETARQYTCDDIVGDATTLPIEIWVTDESGNQDFCNAELTLQDNSNACPDGTSGNRVAIQGLVQTEDNQMVEQVEVMIMADSEAFPAYEMTDDIGQYAFSDLDMYLDYSLEPTKLGDANEGVSTLDLVLIQRHILGLNRLDSPYKVIAADVNSSESVTGSDIVALRKLILGITNEFPNNDAWRFVDAADTFADITDPFPFSEKIGYAQLDTDMGAADFIAVKIGDVNNSVQVNNLSNTSTENRSAITVHAEIINETEESVDARVSLEDVSDLLGLQFTIDYNAVALKLKGISSTDLSINDENIGWGELSMGKAKVSWNTGSTVSDANSFIIHFTKNTADATLESLDINSDLLNAEAYMNSNGAVQTHSLVFNRESEILSQDFKLYQNVPNPFNATTEISFDLPEAGRASLKIYDLNGRLINEIVNEYNKGFNTISLDINDLDATGILYYQLDSKTHTASRKMVVIK